jgi:hypothetical protein
MQGYTNYYCLSLTSYTFLQAYIIKPSVPFKPYKAFIGNLGFAIFDLVDLFCWELMTYDLDLFVDN